MIVIRVVMRLIGGKLVGEQSEAIKQEGSSLNDLRLLKIPSMIHISVVILGPSGHTWPYMVTIGHIWSPFFTATSAPGQIWSNMVNPCPYNAGVST